MTSMQRMVGKLVSLCALVALSAGAPVAHAEAPSGVVNVNEASPEQLMLLPRIGESKAQRILEFRAKTPFKTVTQLGRVKGIGVKSLRLLKPFVRVDGPTTLTEPVSVEDAERVGKAEGIAGAPTSPSKK